MKKKVLTMLLCAMMAVSVFAGCGGSGGASSDVEAGESETGDTEEEEPAAGDTEEEELAAGDTEEEELAAGDTEEEEPAAGDTEEEEPAASDTGELTLDDAEYQPNADYEEYAVVEYTIEDVGTSFIATVSRLADGSKYEVKCNFFGEDQIVVIENGAVISDLTGFMSTDAPNVVQAAEDLANWKPIE